MTVHKKVKPDPRGQVVGKLELKRIGNSTGVILPRELVTRLNLSVGDKFSVTLSADGGIRLTPYDPLFEQAMTVARRGMSRYRNALAELAK